MKVAVDISLYPLDADFIPPIRDVIERFNSHSGIKVVTNPLSTQIFGELDVVMNVLHKEIQTSFESLPKAVFTIRILHRSDDQDD
jgi:uncharacterized protein YqgV (UPF0045/DUF77 family)